MPDTKTVISLNAPTPRWATIVFRIVFVLTKAASVWVAATTLVSNNAKVEILLAFATADGVFWGIGKLLGVEPVEETPKS